MNVSLIISTYNWPKALELVLLSVGKQKKIPNEIIIADDGSDTNTKKLIDSFRNKFSSNIIHVWHEDIGFRKSIILNKAIKMAQSDYIIQIDGDLILHKNFIGDHCRDMHIKSFLFGSRVTLNKALTKKVLKEKKLKFSFFTKGIKKRGRMLYLPFLSFLFNKNSKGNSKKVRGCNLSYWREDAIQINGYNEEFIGWGYEDFEFAQRLINYGVTGKRLKNRAIQYHLYHKEAPKGNTIIGDELLLKTIQNNICFIEKGIEQL